MKLTLWHGSDRRIDQFTDESPDRALHLGTRAQAAMRNPAFLHEVEVDLSRVRRSRDPGGDWSGKIRAARAAGMEAIVYLNRYEGVSADTIARLAASGRLAGLDRLPDRAFLRLVPEAEDSFVLLDPGRAGIIQVIAPIGAGALTLDPRVEAHTYFKSRVEGTGPAETGKNKFH